MTQLVAEIVGDASKFTKATKEAEASAEGFGGKFKNVVSGVGLGIGAAGFDLLKDAVGEGLSKLGEAHDMFVEDQKDQELLAQALKNNIPGWDGNRQGAEDFATAQARLGFEDSDVRKSLGQLVGVTHDLGEAQKLSSLAMDVARAKGIDLATATDVVTKASEGNGRALKAMGIDIGTAKTSAELLDAVQKNVAGSAETWANTSGGKLAAANVKVSEAMEKVGGIVDKVSQVVIPIAADAFAWLADTLGQVWDAVQPVVSTLIDTLGPAFRTIAGVAGEVFGGIMDVVKALTPVFQAVFGVLGTIFGALVDVWKAEFDALKGIIGAVVGFVKGIINGIIGGINGVIGLIDAIKIPSFDIGPIHVDGWNGLNLGKIPYLHSGGIVPGTPGSDQLAMLQAGERVLPRGGTGATVNIQIASFIGSDRDIDRFAQKVADRMRTVLV